MKQNKSSIKLLCLIVFLILNQNVFAQISVKLQQPPPYQFKVEQFWKIILFNNSEQPVNVYLKGTATESVQGKIVEATSSIITLQRGVKYITGRDLAPFTVSESNDRYKNIILNTGSIPSGGYDICVSVFDAADGREIASDCIQTSVENFNRMELITPMDGEVLGIASREEAEINEPKNIQWNNFISDLTRKKKDKDWDEAVGDLKKKKNKDWDEAVGDLKKKKDKDWDEAVGDLKKKKDKDWDEAVGDLKKKKDKDWDEAVGDLKKKKDKDWDEAVGDLKKKKDYDWDEAIGEFKSKIDKNDDRYIVEFKKIIDKNFDQNVNEFNKNKSVSKPINTSNTVPAIIFSWLPPVPVPPDVRMNYKLKVVEIYGNQSVHSAMASNPVYYQSLKLSSTILRYPVAAKQLMPGRKYAWSVEAYIDDFKIQESEIRSFEIQGGEDKKIRYDVSNAGTVQYSKNINADYSGLPSGLTKYNNYYSVNTEHNLIGKLDQDEQENSPDILKLFGDARFTQTATLKQAQYSELPVNYRTLEINPSVSIFDIPIAMNIFISSLNDPDRQSMNSLSFTLDNDRLNTRVKKFINDEVDKNTYSDDSTYSYQVIKAFEVGATYPSYSEFTVDGVQVNGLNIEINPGIIYLAFATGNNAEGIDDVSYKRSFLSTGIGIGQRENAHLIFSFIKMKDDPNSIKLSSSSLASAGSPAVTINSSLTPQENIVLSADAKLNLFDELAEISGEVAASGYTRDLNDADFTNDSFPSFAKSLLTPKLSTSFDYAWKSKIIFDNHPSATFFSFGLRKIGSGFTSFASPNISQDRFQYDVNFNQKFVNNKILMRTFYRTYNDNLINWKNYTTTTTSYGIGLDIYFPEIPFFQFNYSPYLQSDNNDSPEDKIKNRFDMFSLTTGYNYGISNISALTTLTFSGQWQSSKIGILENKTSNESYILNQNLNFEFPLSLNLSFSTSQSKYYDVASNVKDFDINGNYQLSEMISANLGMTISDEENYTKRNIIYCGSSISLSQLFRLEIQGNLTSYTDLSGGENTYDDAMFQATVIINW